MPTSFSRRRFLALSAAAAAGATWFDAPRVLRAANLLKEAGPYGDWPMGVQSYSLREFNTLEAVRHIEGMGLHYAEFYSKHLSPTAGDAEIAETKKLLETAGIALNAHGVHGFSANHDANRKLFEFAKRAGVRNITANPTKDAFDSLDKLCAEFDIRIAIHNHGPGALYDKISDVTSVVKDRHPNIGACVDTGHFLRSKEDPIKAVHELKGRVFALHVKDEEKLEKQSRNVVIGTGHLDLVGLFKALRETNFPADGALSLEYEANPKNPIDEMKACLVAAQEAIAKAATG
ncbi:MAG: sugar phosphate isomerase/epimerase [Planctomycetales bacterium]|nr:sugar phosphate isomerase/epimerase [Planctomycetales bacterium]